MYAIRSYYELGGDSLLAMRVLVRVRERFQRELPLRDIFEKTSVAELADALDDLLKTASKDYFEGEL